MTVVDASALIEWLFAAGSRGAQVAARLTRPGETLHAPELIDLEVLHTLRRLERQGIDAAVATGLATLLPTIPLVRHSHVTHAARIWQLRANLTAYDAAYVALAESLRVPLVTCDARIAAAPGHLADVEVF